MSDCGVSVSVSVCIYSLLNSLVRSATVRLGYKLQLPISDKRARTLLHTEKQILTEHKVRKNRLGSKLRDAPQRL